MNTRFSLIFVVFLVGGAAACSDDKPKSSSGSAGDVVDSGKNACGYTEDCVLATRTGFCSSLQGTTSYECCRPSTPPPAASCRIGSSGESARTAIYCCTATP